MLIRCRLLHITSVVFPFTEKMAEILVEKEISTETTPTEVKGQSVEGQEKAVSDEPFISESEGEPKVATTIFDTESDGGNMHGGI